jgi:hypothetical protein
LRASRPRPTPRAAKSPPGGRGARGGPGCKPAFSPGEKSPTDARIGEDSSRPGGRGPGSDRGRSE